MCNKILLHLHTWLILPSLPILVGVKTVRNLAHLEILVDRGESRFPVTLPVLKSCNFGFELIAKPGEGLAILKSCHLVPLAAQSVATCTTRLPRCPRPLKGLGFYGLEFRIYGYARPMRAVYGLKVRV